VLPKIGAMSVADIGVDDVIRCLEPIWRRIPETASRVRSRIELILAYATVRQFRHGDNPARWRGHLQTLLPSVEKVRAAGHYAALPYAELPAFMAELRKEGSVVARALELTILTAARTGEVLGADWSEIDLAHRVWVIPAERMKLHKEHRVPLCAQAVALFAASGRATAVSSTSTARRCCASCSAFVPV
jgi:integrase